MHNLILKTFLVFFFAIFFVKESYGYCCYCGFFHKNGCCGCNIFSCNCNHKDDGHCWCFPKGYPNSSCLISRQADRNCNYQHNTFHLKIDDNLASTNDPRKIFQDLDKNEDGYISRDEMAESKKYLSNYSPSTGRSSGLMNVTDVLNSLDLNNDGLIQPAEVDESLGEHGKSTLSKRYLLIDFKK